MDREREGSEQTPNKQAWTSPSVRVWVAVLSETHEWKPAQTPPSWAGTGGTVNFSEFGFHPLYNGQNQLCSGLSMDEMKGPEFVFCTMWTSWEASATGTLVLVNRIKNLQESPASVRCAVVPHWLRVLCFPNEPGTCFDLDSGHTVHGACCRDKAAAVGDGTEAPNSPTALEAMVAVGAAFPHVSHLSLCRDWSALTLLPPQAADSHSPADRSRGPHRPGWGLHPVSV